MKKQILISLLTSAVIFCMVAGCGPKPNRIPLTKPDWWEAIPEKPEWWDEVKVNVPVKTEIDYELLEEFDRRDSEINTLVIEGISPVEQRKEFIKYLDIYVTNYRLGPRI